MNFIRNTCKRRLLPLLLPAAMVLAAASTYAQSDEVLTLDIPAQDAGSALLKLAASSNMQIMLPDGAGTRVEVDGLKGEYRFEEALAALLTGTGLKHEFAGENVVVIQEVERAGEPEAADEAPPADDEAPIELPDQTVTGTRLKGVDPASPLVVIQREDIERGGFSSLEDVFRTLPQNHSSITSFSAVQQQRERGVDGIDRLQSPIGASGINLRGIGSRSTLILVNGRRKAAAGQGNGAYTDISSIPLSQVERIEVLLDGSSAVYGADAVAGVVNIILRNDYEGAILQARHEGSSSGADLTRLNASKTFRWDSGFLSLSADVAEDEAADTNKFMISGPMGLGDMTAVGGANLRTFPFSASGDTAAVFPAQRDPFFGFFTWYLNENGVPQGNVPPHPSTQLNPSDTSIDSSVFDRTRIGPAVESRSIRINGEQELGDSLTLDFDVSLGQQENADSWQPTLRGDSWAMLDVHGYTVLTDNNPYFAAAYPGQSLAGVTYRYEEELKQLRFSQEQELDNTDASIGLSGQLPFGYGWDYTFSTGVSKEESQTVSIYGTNSFVADDVKNNLNLLYDPSDANAAAGAVANNVEQLQRLVLTLPYEFETESQSIELHAVNSELLALPAGSVQVALGGQYREERYIRFERRDFANLGDAFYSNSGRDVTAFFVESAIPLLADMAFVRKLTLTVAARYENTDTNGVSTVSDSAYRFDFSTGFPPTATENDIGVDLVDVVGLPRPGGHTFEALGGIAPVATEGADSYSETAPSASLSWQINDDWRVSGTWGESFLAPLPSQLYGNVSLTNFSLGFLLPADLKAGVDPNGIFEVSGSNVLLKPQLADTLSFGFLYTSTALPGLTVHASYSRIEFENYISTNRVFNGSLPDLYPYWENLPEIFIKSADGSKLLLRTGTVNVAKRTSEAIDLDFSYQFTTDVGFWKISLLGTRVLELTERFAAETPDINFAGTEDGPSDFVGTLSVDWQGQAFYARVQVNHSSAHDVVDPYTARRSSVNYDPTKTEFQSSSPSYTTVDLQLGYDSPAESGLMRDVQVQLGAQDLFNPDFPFVDTRAGYLTNRINTRGRVVYFVFSKSF